MSSSQYSWCMELWQNVEEKMKLPKHSLKVGAVALGTAGLAGVCYYNSSDETI